MDHGGVSKPRGFDSLKVGRRPEIWWFEAPKRLRFAKILPAGFYHMGVSENSVPLNPMVLLIIIPFLNGYFIGNIPYFQTNPYFFWMTSMICSPGITANIIRIVRSAVNRLEFTCMTIMMLIYGVCVCAFWRDWCGNVHLTCLSYLSYLSCLSHKS